MSITSLKKNRSSSNSPDSSKYYIKCDAADTSNRIEIVKLLQKQRDADSRVLLAYLNKTHVKINVVVKMGVENGTIRKEYIISEHLHKANCSGFIKFQCIFDCYDNNSMDKICQGTPMKDRKKEVIIMNYINEGSIKNHSWTNSNFHILRSVLQQTICSLIVAYHNAGFIHNDAHLDNILIKRTKKSTFSYVIDEKRIEIETNNYTCVIMDFENCFFTDKSSDIFFWKTMENIITRVGIELKNNKGENIESNNIHNIVKYIADNKTSHYLNALNIIPMIENINFHVLALPKSIVYDPNVY